jgi:hypothetical protein
MSPRPARFSAFDDLALTAQSGGPGLARATLKVQTELFVQHAGQGDAEFLPLALTLLPMVDEATVREIALKLCPVPETPAALIEALFARGGGVAETVVADVRNLPARLRQAALGHGDPRVPSRLAARSDLSDAEQLHLIGRAEPALAIVLAQNHSVELSRPVVAALIGAARHDAALAEAMLARTDIDPVVITPLYQAASTGQRARIRTAIERRIAERGLSLPHREASEAEQARLMEASLDGMPALIADLALVSERDGDFVSAAAGDPTREIVALALVGLGLRPEDTTRMLLRTGDALARDSQALHALVDIVRSTSRASAETIIAASWPRRSARAGTQHVPAMAPGGNTSRGVPGATRKPGSRDIIDQVRARS